MYQPHTQTHGTTPSLIFTSSNQASSLQARKKFTTATRRLLLGFSIIGEVSCYILWVYITAIWMYTDLWTYISIRRLLGFLPFWFPGSNILCLLFLCLVILLVILLLLCKWNYTAIFIKSNIRNCSRISAWESIRLALHGSLALCCDV